MSGILRVPLFLFPAVLCAATGPGGFESQVQPFLTKNCLGCHNAKLQSGELNLAAYRNSSTLKERDLWERVVQKIRTGEMPPKPLPRPKQQDVDGVVGWIEGEFARMDRETPADPGRVTARRLNRFEYNNTVRDLLGVEFRPADDFPADDSGYGFDNIGDVLSLSPVLMEKYLAAADRITGEALGLTPPMKPTAARYKTEEPPRSPLYLSTKHLAPMDAEYEIRVGVGGGKRRYLMPLQLELFVDGKTVGLYSVDTNGDKRRPVMYRTMLTEGEHRLATRLEAPPPDGTKATDRTKNLVVDYIEVLGPYYKGKAPLPRSYARVFTCGHGAGGHTEACAREALTRLAPRAWRRPVTEAEIARLAGFVKMAQTEGEPLERGMQLALKAMLVSPHFLFRVERETAGGSHRVSEFELASRLSYFLWSSMPDDELMRLASEGALRRPGVLESQVRRMLADPKAGALSENFAGQWLQIRNLAEWKPDPDRFPMFTEDLREAMYRETQLFFESVVKEDRSVLEFIDSNYTFLNEPLAKHYGIAGVSGDEFRRVTLPDGRRGGVLSQASILTISSYPTRTSPVLRGKWVLENLLGAPPPPPPPNVPVLEEEAVGNSGSLRQQMEQHRSNTVCASCHTRMDAIGFGLENYNAVGAWRSKDGKFDIDSTGTMPNGKSFQGPAELRRILAEDRDEFARCLTEKMLTYALGRGLERYDRPAVRDIVAKLSKDDYRMSTLILGIVNSLPFQMRRAEGAKT